MQKKTIFLASILLTKTLFSVEASSFYLGPQASAVSLHIEGLSSDFHGTLAGAIFSYNYQKPNALYANASVKWALGEVRSSGQISRFLHDESVEGHLGFAGQFGKMELIPFVGCALSIRFAA